ncbi:MAG: nucleotidyltransferase domain-containing protein [Cyanobacteria bacterium REEB446]|nr:nucleotidyltransferase domain-containing protein [Cyanobacteria bacterium REEB446]
MVRKKTELELKELIDKVISFVTEGFNVDEIILFGSYAKGTENELSDVDIAVISPDLEISKSVCSNALRIKKQVKLFEPYLQLLAFPSQTYYSEDLIDPDFIREIKRTGKTVYPMVK